MIVVGDVLNFRKGDKERSLDEGLSRLMKDAQKLQVEEELSENGLFLSNFEKMEKSIEKSFSNLLVKNRLLDTSLFLCGKYIAKIITETAENPPESWYTIDYLNEIRDDREYVNWQKAADISFLICTIFTGWANRRMMKQEDYVKIGKSCYYVFYTKSKKEIGYLMSIKYRTLLEMTQEALQPP